MYNNKIKVLDFDFLPGLDARGEGFTTVEFCEHSPLKTLLRLLSRLKTPSTSAMMGNLVFSCAVGWQSGTAHRHVKWKYKAFCVALIVLIALHP